MGHAYEKCYGFHISMVTTHDWKMLHVGHEKNATKSLCFSPWSVGFLWNEAVWLEQGVNEFNQFGTVLQHIQQLLYGNGSVSFRFLSSRVGC